MAKNTAIGQRTKHVDIRYQFVNDMVQQGDLTVVHIPDGDNPSDLMTKNLQHASHEKHTSTIVNGLIGDFCDSWNTEDNKLSCATVVSVDCISSVVRPSTNTTNGQTGTELKCSRGSYPRRAFHQAKTLSSW